MQVLDLWQARILAEPETPITLYELATGRYNHLSY